MGFGAILLLAVGLAMDATAVAAAQGTVARDIRGRDVLLIALLFGGSQALMPLAGWWIGRWIGPFIQAWDHWIAFSLLVGLGAKMLWESRRPTESVDVPTRASRPSLATLSVLALATSIDAFAVGITLPMLGAPMLLTLLTIGITTALLSAIASIVGHRVGALFGRRLDALGGLVLVTLGTTILIEHLNA